MMEGGSCHQAFEPPFSWVYKCERVGGNRQLVRSMTTSHITCWHTGSLTLFHLSTSPDRSPLCLNALTMNVRATNDTTTLRPISRIPRQEDHEQGEDRWSHSAWVSVKSLIRILGSEKSGDTCTRADEESRGILEYL
jgi:hypothetical protein